MVKVRRIGAQIRGVDVKTLDDPRPLAKRVPPPLL